MKKKISAFITAFCLLIPVLCLSAAAADKPLDKNAVIVVAADCSETDKTAALALQKYIQQLSGVKHEIVTKSDGKFALRVGTAAECANEVKDLADGSYLIRSGKNGVDIAGAGNRGTIYGAYAFLQEFGGCRWLTGGMGMTSSQKKIILPDSINRDYEAYFEYTDTDWRSPRDVEYSLANGLSGGVYRTIPDEQGGTVSYIGPFCHTLSTTFCSQEKYFAEKPELFALRNGLRTPTQLCLTNEETYEIVRDEVLLLLKENHKPDAALQIVSLTQNDNYNYCECDACKALDEKNGSHAGTMITFVNKIAEDVKKAGYDNVAIDTFAYQYTRTTPTAVTPSDNVIVRLCTIECCFSHALDDPDCPENAALMQDLINWNKICNRLYVWDYTTNYANTLGIFPDFGVIQKNAQIFYEHGVKGVYEEGNYYIDGCDTEFGELRAYLISKCLQDPWCDYDAVMSDFLKGYYGDGWESIKEFIDIITENSAKGHVKIYTSMKESLFLTDDEITYCDGLWEKAKNECKDDTQLENLKRSEISWRFWKASAGKGEFKSAVGGVQDRKALMNDIVAAGTLKASEGAGELKPAALYQYSDADTWFGGSNNSPLVNALLAIAWALFAAAVVLSFIVFIKGIKLKKPVACFLFPLLLASSELAMWHRRAYLAWKDLDQYAISLVIACLVFAFAGFVAAYMKGKSLKGKLLSAAGGFAAFIVLYEAATCIINNVIFRYQGNQLAIASAYILCAAELLVIEIRTVKKKHF
ncbi:MAG: DUF4838 domain-containing protein [Clostridia bacterium]|nr:DUF4838 domain-containing protein [Clostridia bacterium]